MIDKKKNEIHNYIRIKKNSIYSVKILTKKVTNMVQSERLEKIIGFATKQGLSLGVDEQTIQDVLNKLKQNEQLAVYSNDAEIEMIVDKVCKHTDNKDLKDFMSQIIIQNEFTDNPWAVYAKYSSDERHRIVASRIFLKKLEELSNIAATIFVIDYYPQPDLCDVIMQYLTTMVFAFDSNVDSTHTGIDEDYDESYWHVQYLLAETEKKYGYFSDYLIFFAREIYESALSFAIGHEIGHHYLGHIDYLVKRKGIVSDNERKKNEFLADDFGTMFAVEYSKACVMEENPFDFLENKVYKKYDFRLFGIMVLFLLIEIITHNADSSSHPCASTRRKRSIEIMKRLGVEDEMIDSLENLTQCLIKTLEDTRTLIKKKTDKKDYYNAFKEDDVDKFLVFETRDFWSSMGILQIIRKQRFKETFGTSDLHIRDVNKAIEYLKPIMETYQDKILEYIKNQDSEMIVVEIYKIFQKCFTFYIKEKKDRQKIVSQKIMNEELLDIYAHNRNIAMNIITACNIWLENCVLLQEKPLKKSVYIPTS